MAEDTPARGGGAVGVGPPVARVTRPPTGRRRRDRREPSDEVGVDRALREGVLVDGDHDHAAGHVHGRPALVADGDLQRERTRARPRRSGEPHRDAEHGVEARRGEVLEVEHAAHEHDAVARLDLGEREPGGAEELGLGDVEQAV
jgi:hypothetical protein